MFSCLESDSPPSWPISILTGTMRDFTKRPGGLSLPRFRSVFCHDHSLSRDPDLTIDTLQHITYLEWLPIVLGKTAMTQHTILPVTVGYSDRQEWTVFSLCHVITRDCELIKSALSMARSI